MVYGSGAETFGRLLDGDGEACGSQATWPFLTLRLSHHFLHLRGPHLHPYCKNPAGTLSIDLQLLAEMSSRSRGPPKPTPRWSSGTAAGLMVGFFVVWLLLGYAFRPNNKQKFHVPGGVEAESPTRALREPKGTAPAAAAPAVVLPSPPPPATCNLFGSLGMTVSCGASDQS